MTFYILLRKTYKTQISKEGDKMIRKAEFSEFDKILQIYAYAREVMKKSGNPDQWGDDRPKKELLLSYMESGSLYVIEEDGNLTGVFAYIEGKDPTYSYIEDGSILSADGTIRARIKRLF